MVSQHFGCYCISILKRQGFLALFKNSKYINIKQDLLQGNPKKNPKDIWFINPKTMSSGVDQNTKLPSFEPIGQKPLILHRKLFEFEILI